ncbi:hypothetical protein [Methylomonas koyamae]|uniref:hypothetical protein n=1 Tax=Methylomonas koyamae TaxID=702114 RepID=UPI0006D16341|nr:hypothetical protein [Methylomonas koyamae]
MICFARLRSTAAAALALVLLTQPALAGTILSPIAVINNTIGNYKGIAGFPEDTDETPMFNQSGLSLGFTSGVTDFAAYIGSNPTHIGGTPEIGNGWISPAYCPCTGTLDFDLGANYSIKQMALWNMAANSGANVAEINLYSSKTADFAAPTAIGSFTNRKCPTIIARARVSGNGIRPGRFGRPLRQIADQFVLRGLSGFGNRRNRFRRQRRTATAYAMVVCRRQFRHP